LAFDSNGNLYVSNATAAGTVSKFAPGATTASATLTGVTYPEALAFDSSGNLYVADYYSDASGDNGTMVSKFAPGATTPTVELTGVNPELFT
jgi:DNA-binding beta-propeller fold protein YncE